MPYESIEREFRRQQRWFLVGFVLCMLLVGALLFRALRVLGDAADAYAECRKAGTAADICLAGGGH